MKLNSDNIPSPVNPTEVFLKVLMIYFRTLLGDISEFHLTCLFIMNTKCS